MGGGLCVFFRPQNHLECSILRRTLIRETSVAGASDEVVSNGAGDRHYAARVLPYRSVDNYISGAVVTFTDLTATHRAEAALRRSEERLRLVLETDAVGVTFIDPEGVIIDANEVFLKMTGYSRSQLERRELNWRKLTPDEHLDVSEAQMTNLATTGKIGTYEKEYFLADGTRRWMLLAGRDIGDGTLAEFCIDISDRKRAEAALPQSEEQIPVVRRGLFGRLVDPGCRYSGVGLPDASLRCDLWDEPAASNERRWTP